MGIGFGVLCWNTFCVLFLFIVCFGGNVGQYCKGKGRGGEDLGGTDLDEKFIDTQR